MIYCGWNTDILPTLPAEHYDSCVTDAPYGLGKEPNATKMIEAWIKDGYLPVTGGGFMGKKWDAFVPQPLFWKEVYRVLKPGAHVVCFFGSRTYDWGVLAMRLAGFEIRDQLVWLYGEGFPKGKDIFKETEDETFKGWKTALKPAFEPIVLARKPLGEDTISKNMQVYKVGAYNIDATRVGNEIRFNAPGGALGVTGITPQNLTNYEGNTVEGRYPTNVLLSHAEECTNESCVPYCAVELLDTQTAFDGSVRFFYCSKATSDEREIGVKSWQKKISPNNISGGTETRLDGRPVPKRANNHPTVKPIELMRYLCKLITPKGGRIIEPFGGSGTTGVAAKMEFMECDILEQDEYWCKIAEARIAAWKPQFGLDTLFNK